MASRFPLLPTICLAACLSASGAAAQTDQTPTTLLPTSTLPSAGRSGVQLGGIPPFLVSAGAYTRLTEIGPNRLEGRVLVSGVSVQPFISAVGAEADLLLSRPLSERWQVYGGLAAALTSTSVNGQTSYFGLGGLVGVRSGPGLGFFAEAGAATFFGGVTGPLLRLGVNYSF